MTRSGTVDYIAVGVLEGEKKQSKKQVGKLEQQLSRLKEMKLSLRDQMDSFTRLVQKCADRSIDIFSGVDCFVCILNLINVIYHISLYRC